ncbi:hypothetical protein PHYSODRAFT_339505 [Phytophthora sojae]|uniref:RxLR effector protein n=1 Tax=Phytophthora sojae (strain P6497) TaxID=1094619 RepID=G5A718_PHYSP|nr:hypothetical protein PHYSODRAFT_339505 [Phytophthora sojae]EGZ09123.1 hypothetical protein PHYSODRAFT_339505 [Phytophthora sojae]|eukprot:XP_009535756.1 hypothetical protein PHYSODRAFT_339505 [Phytophthora sojae]
MRVHYLFALVVATYAATCNSVVNAENVPQLNDVVAAEADVAQFIGDARELTASNDWWVSDENEEERGLPGASFFSKLRGKASKVSQAKGGTEKLSNTQVKEVTAATANAKFLKILYGATLSALIIVGVTAMLK